jgi:hypothetical protein
VIKIRILGKILPHIYKKKKTKNKIQNNLIIRNLIKNNFFSKKIKISSKKKL